MSEELKPPRKIYLQDYCKDYLSEGNTTWCDDKQNDDDIEYILQSEYDATIQQKDAEIEGLRGALLEISCRSTGTVCDIARKVLEVNYE